MKKINSHLLGFLIVGGAFAVWYMMTKPKVMETYMGYNIIRINGRFVAEKVANERMTNPMFDTVDEVKAWIDNQGKPADIMDMDEMRRLNDTINRAAQ